MALHIPKIGLQTMMKDGAKVDPWWYETPMLTVCRLPQHYSGMEEAIFRNINACKEMAQIVRTSFGPNGAHQTALVLLLLHLQPR